MVQSGVSITDTKIPNLQCTPATSAPLLVGGVITCTGTYAVTASDINAGVPIVNVASARSAQVTTPVVASVSVNVFSFPQFTAVKTASVLSVSAAGTPITYSIEVRNTGTVTLTGLTVSDPRVPSLSCSPVAQGASLPRAASTVCTGVYTTTQQDINGGVPIVNTASVTFANAGTVLTSATVGVNSVTAFTVVKSASPTVVTGGAGSTVLYSVVVANTGSADLTGFQINDPLFPSGMSCNPIAPGQTLGRGASTTCSASYTVTAGDVSRGTIVNVVTVTLGGLQRTASVVVTIQGQQQGSLTLSKTADPVFVSTVGQVIRYTLVARNNGNGNLLGVTISDPLLPNLVCQPLNNGQALAPGTFLSCEGSLIVSQAQINSGIIVNNAQATANGGAIIARASTTVVVSSTPPPQTTTTTAPVVTGTGSATTTPSSNTPTIFFSKTSSPEIVSAAGQTIQYTIRATNGGLATINNVVVSDPTLGFLQCSPAAGSSLASGATMTCVGSAVVTTAQIQSGADIINTATVNANGVTSITQAKATVKVAASGTIAVSKTTTATQYSVVGSRIPYRITILNNLNVNAQNLVRLLIWGFDFLI